MIRLFCGKLLQISRRTSPFPLGSSFFLYPASFKFISGHFNSESLHSLTVYYLLKSCGLSLESAISVSKKVNLDTSTKNPDLVLNLLREHGLNDTHIRNLITSRPLILLADAGNTKSNLEVFKSLGISGFPLAKMLTKESRMLDVDAKTTVEFFRENGFKDEQITTLTMRRPRLYVYQAHKNFKPKLEYFKSLGFSQLEVAQILSAKPYMLQSSLENQIIPCVHVIRRVVGDDTNVRKALRASYRILEVNKVDKVLEPNMLMLEKHGVPQSLILKVFLLWPKTFLLNSDEMGEIIGKVKRMGFDPKNLAFVLAVHCMAVPNIALWERKLEAFRSFGFSNDEIHLAFELKPLCMMVSVNKITKLLNFYVNKLNIRPPTISKRPILMLFSLEQRILPRCSVLNILMSKGLIKEDFNLIYMFTMANNMFVKRVVGKYQDMVPEIVEAHQGTIEFKGFSRDSKV